MKVVFLDRDGTIIVDPPNERVDSLDKIELLPNTLDALQYLAENDFSVIIISNQEYIDEATLKLINDKVLDLVAPSGIKILKTYVCPHAVTDKCTCRKPLPFMLKNAADDFNLNLRDIFMVGDRSTDVLAGKSAGTKTIFLNNPTHSLEDVQPDYKALDLLDAVKYVVSYS